MVAATFAIRHNSFVQETALGHVHLMTEHDPALQTRPSLLMRLKNARDDAAWSQFLEIYAPVVYRYCRRRGLQDGDACAVTQEVMAQVARTAPQFDYHPERGRFRDWLGVLARNKLIDHARTAARAARLVNGSALDPDKIAANGADSDWSEEFDAQLYRAALERIRTHFEPTSWRAFELTWVDGEPAASAARALGISVDTVYVAKSRILKRLREEVLALADELPVYSPLA